MPGLDPHIPELDAYLEEASKQPEIDAILRLYYPTMAKQRKRAVLVRVVSEKVGVEYTMNRIKTDSLRLGLQGKGGEDE